MGDVEFGPHTKRVRDEVARLNAVAWLAPDTEMDALGPGALEFLRERLDEHFAALAKAVPSFSPPEARVETHRDVADAAARMLRARDGAAPPGPPPPFDLGGPLPRFDDHAKRWLDALREAMRESYQGDRVQLANTAFEGVPHVYYKLGAEHALSVPWLAQVWSSGPTMNHPGYPAMGAHLRWIARHGDARPSPWSPVIALFERGVFPMVSADATLVVWVPLRAEGRVVPNATGEPVALPTRGMTGSPSDDESVRAFHEAGFAPIPMRVAYPPTPNLPVAMPPPPRPPRPPFATVNPPPQPRQPPPGSTPEPWYRRLFKRK